MILVIDNHKFHYEMENLCRVFFPYEKITVTNEDNEEDSKKAITGLSQADDVYNISVTVSVSGESVVKNQTADKDSTEDELEIMMARNLFDALCEITGYVPDWGILTGVRPSKLMTAIVDEVGEETAKAYFIEKLKVSERKTELALNVAKAEEKIIKNSKPESMSLYVSIPFCPTRCSYCSFVSHSIKNAHKLMPVYTEYLCKEIDVLGETVKDLGLKLESIYFGGGTPTILNAEQLKQIFDAIERNFDVSSVSEYTVEAGRPDTITTSVLNELKRAGVGRISINPQTFNDDVLEKIGREHSSLRTLEAFRLAREAGHDNINMDLIAGLPTDTLGSFEKSLKQTIQLDPENITIHTLALKRSSNLFRENETEMSSGKLTAQMLEVASKLLYESGYFPYYMYRQSRCIGNLENVGWSKPGYECLYNIYMMEECHTVLGVGAGSVTKLKQPNGTYIERIFNYKYPYEYLDNFDALMERKSRIKEFYEEFYNAESK